MLYWETLMVLQTIRVYFPLNFQQRRLGFRQMAAAGLFENDHDFLDVSQGVGAVLFNDKTNPFVPTGLHQPSLIPFPGNKSPSYYHNAPDGAKNNFSST